MRKAPKHAKQVFKGTVFEIYQWKQEMFNGTTRTFENAKILGGPTVFATYRGKIVVLYQQQPGTKWYYTLPGGYLDHENESPKDAAVRELQEETGLKPKSIKLWKKIGHPGRIDSQAYLFVAKNCEKVGGQKLDGGEKIKVMYKTFEQLLKMSDDPKFHNNDVIIELLKARVNPKKKAELKKLLFG